MYAIQRQMIRLHSYLPLCLPFKDICSASIATYHYVCHSGIYAPSPYLLTIMYAIEGHMLRLHSYLPLCLPFRDICSASIVSPREPYITPRATSPRGDIGRRLIRHVIQIFTCNVHYVSYISTMPLIIHVFYEQILNLEFF